MSFPEISVAGELIRLFKKVRNKLFARVRQKKKKARGSKEQRDRGISFNF